MTLVLRLTGYHEAAHSERHRTDNFFCSLLIPIRFYSNTTLRLQRQRQKKGSANFLEFYCKEENDEEDAARQILLQQH